MKPFLLLIISTFILISCKHDNINDKSKRNQNWDWWVDAKTGKGEWIPVGDSTTVKNGMCTSFYFNGNICTKAKLVDGKDVDTIFFYNINGQIDFYHFIKPITNCSYIIDETRDTIYYYFINDGNHKIYNNKGILLQQGYIKDHVKYGKWTGYYEDGNRKYVVNFIQDSSWYNVYYENGQISDSSFDFNNKRTFGRCKSWYGNGQLKASIQWRKRTLNDTGNVQEGITIEYKERDDQSESVLDAISFFKNGLRDGNELIYYGNGQLKDSFNEINNKKEGLGKIWYENGKLKSLLFWEDDNLTREDDFDENGQLITDSTSQ